MPDINDVVRHVILRIVVDQGRLADDLAAARSRLKAFEQAERDSNKARSKDAEQVTAAVRRQTEALEENARAHQAARSSATGTANTIAEQHKAATTAIKAESKALGEQADQQRKNEASAASNRRKDSDALAANLRKDRAAEEELARVKRRNHLENMLNVAAAAAAQKKLDDDALARASRIKAERAKDVSTISVSGSKARTESARAGTTEVRQADVEDAAAIAWDRRRQQALNAQAAELAQITALTARARREEELAAQAAEKHAESLKKRRGAVRESLADLGRLAQQVARAGADAVPQRPSRLQRGLQAFDQARPTGGVASGAAGFFAEIVKSSARAERNVDQVTNSFASLSKRFEKLRADIAIPGDNVGFLRGLRNAIANFDNATPAIQRYQNAARAAREETAKLGSEASTLRRLRTIVVEFGSSASTTFDRTRSRFRAMREELSHADVGGGGIGGRILDAFSNMGTGVDNVIKNLTRHLFSYRTLIVAVIAALGPLGAILGSVGAAALGLAANLGSLTGVLFALPGLIGAAVGAFGVLAAVMAPLAKVFSAYKAVSDASTKSTKAAADAQTDAAQAQEKLNEARQTAARRIQDYRLALQKLKYDEEGANLGVENAQAEYRKALADPTATALDRKNARHALEGALFDQRDQKVTTGRTQEDAAVAEKKGVEGSDEVVAALQALAQAQKAAAAGGTAAADAQDKLEAELGKLGPKTRIVVEATKALSGTWTQLQKDLSDAVFGPISDDTDKFKTVLGELRTFLMPTAEAFGYLADKALKLFTNDDWKKFFAEQGTVNGQIVEDLGDALLNIADAFRGILEAARPFTLWLTGAFKDLTAGFAEWANSAEGKNGIRDFLDDTKQRITELWPIIKNFAAGIAGFWTALTKPAGGEEDFTSKINDGLLGISKNFRKLGEEAANPNSGFRKWLKEVGPLIKSTASGVAAVAKFFGRLFSDKANIEEAQKILKSLSEDILPKLSDFFEHLSSSGVISSIAKGISGIVTALDRFLESGGSDALHIFFVTLSKIGTIVSFLSSAFPHLTTAVTLLVGALALLTGAAVVARLTGILSLVTGAFKLLGSFKGAQGTSGVLGRAKDLALGRWDSKKDEALGKDTGVSAAERDARNQGKNTPGGKPGKPDLTGTGGVTAHLTRIERLLAQIVANTARSGKGGAGGYGVDVDNDPNKPRPSGGTGKRPRPSGGVHPGSILEPDLPENRHPGNTAAPTGGTGTSGSRTPASQPVTGGSRPRRPSRVSRLASLLGGLFGTSAAAASTSTVLEGEVLPASSDRRTRTTTATALEPHPGQPWNYIDRDPALPSAARPLPGTETASELPDRPGRPGVESGTSRPPLGTTDPIRQLPATSSTIALPGSTQDPRDARGRFRKRLPGEAGSAPVRDSKGRFVPRSSQFETVESASSRRRDFEIVESASQRPTTREQRVLGAPDRRELTTGPAQPVRGTSGQFTSPDKPLKPSLVNTGTDYNVYTDDDGRPITATGEKPTKKRYTTVPAGTVKSFSEPTSAALDEERNPKKKPRGDEGFFDVDKAKTQWAKLRSRFSRRGKTAALEGDVLTREEADEARTRRSRSLGLDEVEESGSRRTRGRRGLASAVDEVEDVASRATRGGRFGRVAGGLGRAAGGLGRVAGGLARGIGGGLAGLALSGAMSLGGDYLLNKFVKNDEDKASLSRGLGAVSQGAGMGAMIGSVIPGVGTAIGGLVGGAAGGIYSLVKDKNLRNFVGDKVSGAWDATKDAVGGVASKAWGGIKGVGSAAKDLFTGGGGGPSAALLGPIGGLLAKTDIGKSIFESLNKAGGKIGDFFTKTIPGFFRKGMAGVTEFFTKTLPSLPGRAFDAFFRAIGRIGAFFTKDLPRFASRAFDTFFIGVGRIAAFFIKDLPHYAAMAVTGIFRAWVRFQRFMYIDLPKMVWHFFTDVIPEAAGKAWGFIKANLWDPFLNFVRAIPGFFTKTIPHWFASAWHWAQQHIGRPLRKFVLETVPQFFTETIPRWFVEAPKWFKAHVMDPVAKFVTVTLPNFITVDLPNAIKKLPSFIYNNLVQPVLDFFKGIAGHIGDFLKGSWDWAKGLFNRASADVSAGYNTENKMSGGLIQGIYQGIEDKVHVMATPGEFYVRKSKVDQPHGKRFLNDFNEGRFDPSAWYGGLAQATAPGAMSLVPPDASTFTGQVPTIVNHHADNSLNYGDVIIHNPVREKSEHSLRRQLQIANIRHRR